MDLAVSTASTVICSIFTTPQMVVTDRVMAGVKFSLIFFRSFYMLFQFLLSKLRNIIGLYSIYSIYVYYFQNKLRFSVCVRSLHCIL